MHVHIATLLAATLLLVGAISNAGAQANPNKPLAQASLYTWLNGYPGTACPVQQETGTTASSDVSASATCATGAAYAGGDITSAASGALTGRSFSSSASLDGVLNSKAEAYAQGAGYTWNFYTISDPASVFRIVLTASVNSAASAARAQDYAYAQGYLTAATVEASSGYLVSYLGYQSRTSGAGGYAYYQNLTQGCSRSGYCTNSITASNTISTDLLGSDLNSNGIFAAYIQAYAFIESYNGDASPITASDAASAYFDAPTVTLYDIDGNDVTSLHSITEDRAAVVATPEPAGIALLGTGLISVFLVRRRRTVTR